MRKNKLPIKFDSKKISYKGHQIQTYSIGENVDNTIFVLPPLPHSGTSLFYFWEYSKELNPRFITLDIPGWIGKSQNIFKGFTFDDNEIIAIINQILNDYKVDTFSLLGYSFGTSISIKFAAQNNERIKRIALISALVNGTLFKRDWRSLALSAAYKARLYEIVKPYINMKYKKYRKEMLTAGFEEIFLDYYKELLTGIDSKTILTSLYKLFNSDYTDYLKQLDSKKILVINSLDESKFLRKQSEYIRRHLNLEKTMFVHGNHEDLSIRPNYQNIKDIVHFLTH